MLSVFCNVKFPIHKTNKLKSPGSKRKLFLFKGQTEKVSHWLSLCVTVFVFGRTHGGLFFLTFLTDPSRGPDGTRSACRRPELTALWSLVKHQATSFPECQSWSSGAARWAGGREVEPFCSLQQVPLSLPPGCELALHARSLRAQLLWAE